jgi:hypothetical protein
MPEANSLFFLQKLIFITLKEFLWSIYKTSNPKTDDMYRNSGKTDFQPNTDEPTDSGPSLCHGILMTNSIIRCDPLDGLTGSERRFSLSVSLL